MALGLTSTPTRFGDHLKNHDSFLDEYVEEELTCTDIIEYIGSCAQAEITMTLDKDFAMRIARSHIFYIRELRKVMR